MLPFLREQAPSVEILNCSACKWSKSFRRTSTSTFIHGKGCPSRHGLLVLVYILNTSLNIQCYLIQCCVWCCPFLENRRLPQKFKTVASENRASPCVEMLPFLRKQVPSVEIENCSACKSSKPYGRNVALPYKTGAFRTSLKLLRS